MTDQERSDEETRAVARVAQTIEEGLRRYVDLSVAVNALSTVLIHALGDALISAQKCRKPGCTCLADVKTGIQTLSDRLLIVKDAENTKEAVEFCGDYDVVSGRVVKRSHKAVG